MLLWKAEPEEIRAVLGRRGGFTLELGGDAVPGTSVENYRIMIEVTRTTPVAA